MEGTQNKINEIKAKLTGGEYKDAQFFAKQEEMEDLNDALDRQKDKYKQCIEDEKKKKKSQQIIPKFERIEKIEYIFVTFKNVESVESAIKHFEIQPTPSKLFRCIFCIKNTKQQRKEFLKHELHVEEVFEPDEIIWDNLMTDSQSGVKMKLMMTIFSVLTIGCTTIL